MKYSHREPTFIAIHVFAITHEDFLKKELKPDLKLSEQLEYKCHLGKVISVLNPRWYAFAVVRFQQN